MFLNIGLSFFQRLTYGFHLNCRTISIMMLQKKHISKIVTCLFSHLYNVWYDILKLEIKRNRMCCFLLVFGLNWPSFPFSLYRISNLHKHNHIFLPQDFIWCAWPRYILLHFCNKISQIKASPPWWYVHIMMAHIILISYSKPNALIR